MNRFLVIGRVGDRSLHPHWLQGAQPLFDVYLSYFGDEPEKYKDQAQYYEQVKGGKWPVLARIVQENPEIMQKYDAVWMPDDDLLIDAHQINRMFQFFMAFELQLAQPALSEDSYFSHSSLLKPHVQSVLRYVNFIEVMAPIFSKACLTQLTPTLSQSPSGWGLDNLWPNLLNNPDKTAIAVIDAVTVVHTRPVGGELYKKNPELSPKRDVEQLQLLYPQLDIDRRSNKNKFRVYSQVSASALLSETSSFVVGKIQRIKAKLRSKNVPKYKSPV